MPTETRKTDASSRVRLPKSFANSIVIVEQISESEVCTNGRVGLRMF
jgi:hypothetical protein